MRDQLARDVESELLVLPKLLSVQCSGARDFQLYLDATHSAGAAAAAAAAAAGCRGLLLLALVLLEPLLLPLACAFL